MVNGSSVVLAASKGHWHRSFAVLILPEASAELGALTVAELGALENLGNGRHLFSGSVVINRSGSFGYTVRVFPKHPALASKAELGLIANV
ncbi:hypothetical protein [Arthrobacter sp. CJ23]|uniref:hypothetical protein n=1 Tax=Arthrobacter sp. CJ23 TaxID=2972479 RepID=UPI00215D064A|nr:hypothetical protein [Arthrobacter sp. CJ23]UVJ41714.1 hypothetical protein NVV90_16375 [Arthrobacter sp. CJ23]